MARFRCTATNVVAATPVSAAFFTTISSTFCSQKASTKGVSYYASNVTKKLQLSSFNLRRQQLIPRKIISSKGPTKRDFTSTVKTKDKQSFLQWYESQLESRPIPTKMITGSVLWGLGDTVAQVTPRLLFDKGEGPSGEVKHESIYDFPRTARAVFFGFAIHSPLSHVHFNFLEWMTVKGGLTGLSIPVFKTIMEQFVYWSWFSNSLYHGAMGALQGMTIHQIYDRIKDVLWDTQKAQWSFWVPIQLLNFRFVPVRHQLNVVLLTSVVWTALLSLWYPPPDDSTKLIETEEKELQKE